MADKFVGLRSLGFSDGIICTYVDAGTYFCDSHRESDPAETDI